MSKSYWPAEGDQVRHESSNGQGPVMVVTGTGFARVEWWDDGELRHAFVANGAIRKIEEPAEEPA